MCESVCFYIVCNRRLLNLFQLINAIALQLHKKSQPAMRVPRLHYKIFLYMLPAYKLKI